jgi:UDP-glucose 4-epimerase
MKMNKYLLIGGNGVIGHFVARRLVGEGHRPIVMSRGGDTTLISDILDQCVNVRADMTDRAALDNIVGSNGVTHIVHLGAALPSVTEVDPIAATRLNIEGTVNVLEAAKTHGVKRVVMASTKAVYGRVSGQHAAPTYLPVPETAADPVTVYGITKRTCELLGRWYQKTHGIEFIALRFAATIGPGKIARHGGSYSRYSVVVENAMAGKPVDIPSGADEVCDLLYNDEAARGVICALHASQPLHDIYNIATGTGFTMRQYAEAVRRLYPDADISIGNKPSTNANFVHDVSRARTDLGFVSDANVDHIVRDYIATMRLLGLTPDIG